MNSNIIGIDLAKNIFSICVMNKEGRVLKRKTVTRARLVDTVVRYCGKGIVAMEACGGSNYFARKFIALGYEVRLIAAQFVKPYVKSNKNDKADAEAICEAASRKEMRFVTVRSEWQQDIQNIHRVRSRLMKQRTAICSEIRGLLFEYGIVIPKGITYIRRHLREILDYHRAFQSPIWYKTFKELHEEFIEIDKRIASKDKELEVIAREIASVKRLLKVPGVGIITATAIYAAVGDPKDFKNGRQFSACLGLTPRQTSTGGKTKLGRITKRGDKYIRSLLIQGTSSVLIAIRNKKKRDKFSLWAWRLHTTKGHKHACVAIANKLARIIWVVLNGEEFKTVEQLEAMKLLAA